jgi:hypothetical protein
LQLRCALLQPAYACHLKENETTSLKWIGINMNLFKLLTIFWLAIVLVACSSNDPGPLGGTWKLNGVVPMTVHFRKGESEVMGMIEKVSYKVEGNQVIVTSKSGPMKGISVKYVITGSNTVNSGLGTLTRIK